MKRIYKSLGVGLLLILIMASLVGCLGAIESIKITHEPTKKIYQLGQDLDLSGGKILAKYAKGEREILMSDGGVDVSGFNKNSAGSQTITVTYKGKTDEFEVVVSEPQSPTPTITTIAVKSGSLKSEYFVGDNLEVSGGKLTVNFSDGTSEEVDITAAMVTNFDSSAAAQSKNITVSYEGKTTTFAVNIVAIRLESITLDTELAKKRFILGEEFSFSGIKVSATFNDTRKNRELTGSEFEVNSTDFNKENVGEYTIVVATKLANMAQKSANYSVNVADDLLSIELNKTHLDLFSGDEIDSIIVTGNFESGAKDITDEAESDILTAFDKDIAGDYTVTYSFGGKTTQLTVIVTQIELEDIEATTEKLQLNFSEDLVEEDFEVNAIFNDTRKNRRLTSDEFTISYSKAVGETEVLITSIVDNYAQKTDTVTVNFADELTSISLSTTELTILSDEELSFSQTVTATYLSGASVETTDAENDLDAQIVKNEHGKYDGGNYTITYTLGEKTATLSLKIVDYVKSVEFKGAPDKTEYFDFERDRGGFLNVNLRGLSAETLYASGIKTDIDLEFIGKNDDLHVGLYSFEVDEATHYYIKVFAYVPTKTEEEEVETFMTADQIPLVGFEEFSHKELTAAREKSKAQSSLDNALLGQKLALFSDENISYSYTFLAQYSLEISIIESEKGLLELSKNELVYPVNQQNELDLSDITVKLGEETVNLTEAIGDDRVALEGAYDLEKAGKYTLAITIRNDGDVESFGKITVFVVDTEKAIWFRFSSPFKLNLPLDFEPNLENPASKGLDLSQIPVDIYWVDEWLEDFTLSDIDGLIDNEVVAISHNADFSQKGNYNGYIIQLVEDLSEHLFNEPYYGAALPFEIIVD